MSEEPSPKVARNAFVTTLVAILMNPVSVAVGYFLNQRLQRPRMAIQYIDENFIAENHVLPESIVNSVKMHQGLEAGLRDAITRLSAERNEASCVGWLDREPWLDRCGAIVSEAARGIINAIEARAVAPPSEIERIAPRLSPPVARVQVQSLRALLQGLKNMEDHPDTPRTGEVSFQAGVLNGGDSDGVLFNRAKLRFQGKELWLWADTFTVVKSHSFEAVEFHIGDVEQDSEALAKWTRLVKDRGSITFELLVKVGDDAYISTTHTL